MARVEKSALVRYSAKQMFDLVDDIAAYPEFLPWCRASKVLSRQNNLVEAELTIAHAGFNHSFATKNTCIADSEIRMSLLRGPFKSLEGTWHFIALREDASKISLDLQFEMSGTLVNLAFSAVFNQICNTLVSAFTERAKAIYGLNHDKN